MADGLPEVLALLYESGKRWTTLRAEGEERVDDEGNREAFLRSVPPGALVTSRGAPGLADSDAPWKIWVRQPEEFRAEFGGAHGMRTQMIANGGAQRVRTTGPMSTDRVSDRRGDVPLSLGPAEVLVRPLLLPTALDLEVVGPATGLGRRVIVVRGRPRVEPEPRIRFVTRGADEMEFALDAERGVILWLEARLRGRPFWRTTMTAVAFDEDLDDELFAIGHVERQPDPARLPPHTPPREGPPDLVLGAPVGGTIVVVREPSFVIAVDRVTAYPNGFELGITVRTREAPVQGSFDPGRRRSWSGSAAFPGESLQVRVDQRLTIVPISGSGTQSRFDQRFWVTPLPPPGPVTIAVEWPGRGLAETRAQLDGNAIVAAAATAETLWS